jgi:hypothetical protein
MDESIDSMPVLNSKTTLVDPDGRSSLGLAVRRSGVRIPTGPPIFQYRIDRCAVLAMRR